MTTHPSPGPCAGRRLGFIDVTLRDAHQCLWSTRMTTDMMLPIVADIDRAGYDWINVLGGAVFDVCVRFLGENPYRRMRALTSRLSTPCDALTRGQSIYTFELFPDDVVELNVARLAACGLRMLTVYDALNDNRNLESSIAAAHRHGMAVNAEVVYVVSPVHTDAYYEERVRELVALGADHIAIKDASGLLLPERARTLCPTVRRAAGRTPVQIHSHCQSGMTPEVYAEAIRAGFDYAQTATAPLANGASLPAVEEIRARALEAGCAVRLDPEALAEVAGWFRWLCVREDRPQGRVATYDPALWRHQVPGGMISNLRSQLAQMGMSERLPEILEEAAIVREDLGYPILVSPFAQYIVTQAVLNVVQGERYRTIPDEVRKYAMGHYGRLAARPSDRFLERANVEPGVLSKQRPGSRIEPWLPRLRRRHGPQASDEELLLRAFYPADLVDPLLGPEPEYTARATRTTPLRELVRYLRDRRDLEQIRVKFGGTELGFTRA